MNRKCNAIMIIYNNCKQFEYPIYAILCISHNTIQLHSQYKLAIAMT